MHAPRRQVYETGCYYFIGIILCVDFNNFFLSCLIVTLHVFFIYISLSNNKI